MSRKIIQQNELMKVTEKLLLEQGYGGFNFSVLSKMLHVGRSTLYEYYASKDDLIVDYMNELMVKYTEDLFQISRESHAEEQFILLIELMIKYSHIHRILQMIPLLDSKSKNVKEMKKQFMIDHRQIIKEIQNIIENGKRENLIRDEIPTDVLMNLLFNTINQPPALQMDDKAWARWIWEILYKGVRK